MTRRRLIAAAVVGIALCAAACRKDPSDAWRGMNVIWISFDSVRSDHCSFNGYGRSTTPNLDRIAARGVRFPRTIAQAPYTLPSYASMLTSRYVSELAVQEQRDEKDASKVLGIAPGPSPADVLVSEALHDAGYRTAAFVQSWVSKPFGFDQGWDLFRHAQESLREKMPHVLDWIEKNRRDRFFVFLYATDTHYPFLRAHERRNLYGKFASAFDFTLDGIEAVRAGKLHPSADDLANAMAMYDEGIHWTDEDLAPLFAYLERSGLAEKTIVVFNADHGEEFDEHGVISHGQTYYDGVIRTPLVIAAPGMSGPGRAVPDLVQNIDVAPTLLDMIGVARPRGWSGRSLKPTLAGDQPTSPGPRAAFCEGAWTFWIGSVVEENRKFILVTPQERLLFDVAKDPGETSNLAAASPDGVRALYHALMRHLGGPGEWIAAQGPDKPPSRETWMKQVMGHYGLGEQSDVVKELRSLGYLH
ncbi:MAG TPA: sulfatase [Thermoanaerobaculia bacterium]|jgi:choline-sulfatase|nr:sulfatase [Thermoanaerobaculia bacterium]